MLYNRKKGCAEAAVTIKDVSINHSATGHIKEGECLEVYSILSVSMDLDWLEWRAGGTIR